MATKRRTLPTTLLNPLAETKASQAAISPSEKEVELPPHPGGVDDRSFESDGEFTSRVPTPSSKPRPESAEPGLFASVGVGECDGHVRARLGESSAFPAHHHCEDQNGLGKA